MKILITGAQGPAGLALARQLVGTGHSVIGLDMAEPKAENRKLFSCTELVPAANDPQMIPTVISAIERHQVDLYIPTVQDELPAVARANQQNEFGCPVVISSPVAVELAHDKLFTTIVLQLAGVSVPKTRGLGGTDQEEILAEAEPPFIIKPRCSRGGRGVQIYDERPNHPIYGENQIIQEFAPGAEYAVQLYIPETDEQGEAEIVVLAKTEMKQGRIGNALSTQRLPKGAASEVAELALDAAEALGLVGPMDMDIRISRQGKPVVLEINARFGANSEAAPELLGRVLAKAQLKKLELVS